MSYDDAGQPVLERDSQGQPVGMWITLTICGTTIPGYGSVDPGKRDAIKELIGAWSRCHRKDQRVPHYVSVNRRMYDKGRSLWKDDPAAMLVKCAKAKAMREAFPTELGGLVVEGEFEATVSAKDDRPRIASAFTKQDVEELPPVAEEVQAKCATCGCQTPADLLDNGDCPDCFAEKERG